MKSVMLSVQPKWCKLIASGKKIIEVRKTRPALETPFKCYIYCTKDNTDYVPSRIWWRADKSGFQHILNGKVIGEFVCDGIRAEKEIADGLVDVGLALQSCLNSGELLRYADGKALYSWHISDLKIYDEPKALSDFFVYCERCDKRPIECKYGYEINNENGYYSECMCDFKRPIERPPQSWCYVEEG